MPTRAHIASDRASRRLPNPAVFDASTNPFVVEAPCKYDVDYIGGQIDHAAILCTRATGASAAKRR